MLFERRSVHSAARPDIAAETAATQVVGCRLRDRCEVAREDLYGSCMDGPLSASFFGVSASGSGAVMYPAFFARCVAGPDGVRGRVPYHLLVLWCTMTQSECPDPDF
jgi:hypothetical protein